MSQNDQKIYTKYLDPVNVSKLNTFELKAKLVVEGFMAGLHKSPYHGFSAEFSEHRPYMQGDNLKNIDWKAYAKTERYYVKQFEEETNLVSHIILDKSRSMDFSFAGRIKKIDYAAILAASLMYIMIHQKDAAGLALYSDKIDAWMPPRSTRTYLNILLRTIEANKPSDSTSTAACLNLIAEKIKRKGMIVVISDFFDNPDEIINSLKHFRYKKNEVVVFQILDPVEKSFAFGQDAVFKDMETGEEMTTQPYQIQKSYQQAMNLFTEKMKEECLNSGIEYNLIDTSMPFDKALFAYFKKRRRLH
jgi:uncharacterized protein (DUF58 family)